MNVALQKQFMDFKICTYQLQLCVHKGLKTKTHIRQNMQCLPTPLTETVFKTQTAGSDLEFFVYNNLHNFKL